MAKEYSPLMCAGCPFMEAQFVAFQPDRYYCRLTPDAVLLTSDYAGLGECWRDKEEVIQQSRKRIDWYNATIGRREDLEAGRVALAVYRQEEKAAKAVPAA